MKLIVTLFILYILYIIARAFSAKHQKSTAQNKIQELTQKTLQTPDDILAWTNLGSAYFALAQESTDIEKQKKAIAEGDSHFATALMLSPKSVSTLETWGLRCGETAGAALSADLNETLALRMNELFEKAEVIFPNISGYLRWKEAIVAVLDNNDISEFLPGTLAHKLMYVTEHILRLKPDDAEVASDCLFDLDYTLSVSNAPPALYAAAFSLFANIPQDQLDEDTAAIWDEWQETASGQQQKPSPSVDSAQKRADLWQDLKPSRSEQKITQPATEQISPQKKPSTLYNKNPDEDLSATPSQNKNKSQYQTIQTASSAQKSAKKTTEEASSQNTIPEKVTRDKPSLHADEPAYVPTRASMTAPASSVESVYTQPASAVAEEDFSHVAQSKNTVDVSSLPAPFTSTEAKNASSHVTFPLQSEFPQVTLFRRSYTAPRYERQIPEQPKSAEEATSDTGKTPARHAYSTPNYGQEVSEEAQNKARPRSDGQAVPGQRMPSPTLARPGYLDRRLPDYTRKNKPSS